MRLTPALQKHRPWRQIKFEIWSYLCDEEISSIVETIRRRNGQRRRRHGRRRRRRLLMRRARAHASAHRRHRRRRCRRRRHGGDVIASQQCVVVWVALKTEFLCKNTKKLDAFLPPLSPILHSYICVWSQRWR